MPLLLEEIRTKKLCHQYSCKHRHTFFLLPYCYTISFSKKKGFTWRGGSVSNVPVTQALVLEIGFPAPIKNRA